MEKQNSRWQPMTLREVVGLFCVTLKETSRQKGEGP